MRNLDSLFRRTEEVVVQRDVCVETNTFACRPLSTEIFCAVSVAYSLHCHHDSMDHNYITIERRKFRQRGTPPFGPPPWTYRFWCAARWTSSGTCWTSQGTCWTSEGTCWSSHLLVLPRARLCFVAELLVKVVVGVALAKAAYLQSAALLAKGALRRQTALTLRLQCAAGVFTSRCHVVVEVSLPMVHTIFFGTA